MSVTIPSIDSIRIKVVKMDPHAGIPRYATDGSSGMDLIALRDCALEPFERRLFGTGLAFQIPVGVEGQIRSRSGQALKKGLIVLNSPGTIDSDFIGEVGVILFNASNECAHVAAGERIAQIVFAPYFKAGLVEVAELQPTERGEGGFGSTGLK